VLDQAVYSAFESTLNSSIVSYRKNKQHWKPLTTGKPKRQWLHVTDNFHHCPLVSKKWRRIYTIIQKLQIQWPTLQNHGVWLESSWFPWLSIVPIYMSNGSRQEGVVLSPYLFSRHY